MNRQRMIEQLEQLDQQLASQITALGNPLCSGLKFDSKLFPQAYSRWRDYQTVCRDNLLRLNTLRERNAELFVWQGQRLLAQYQALLRQCQPLFRQPARSSQRPQNTLEAQVMLHRDYERRLQEMMAQYQHDLERVTEFALQQQLLQRLEVTDGRLLRCQMALRKLEWQLAIQGSA